MTDIPGLILLGLRFGLAICLYLFLFWVVRILWRDLKSSAPPEVTSPPLLYLHFSRESEIESPVALAALENLIGRAPDCNIQFDNSTVSNFHARIFYSQSQWWLEDLNSSNGTYLNDNQVHQPTVLAVNDQLRLGSLETIIEIHAPQPVKDD